MARPRNVTARRKPCGRIYSKPDDPREEAVQRRVIQYGVTKTQSKSPLSGYLAGRLFLRGSLTLEHLGYFYSFLQMTPRSGLKSIPLKPRIQSSKRDNQVALSYRYMEMTRHLGRRSIDILHALANDILIAPINDVKAALEQVPLTKGGYRFISLCETHNPHKSARRR